MLTFTDSNVISTSSAVVYSIDVNPFTASLFNFTCNSGAAAVASHAIDFGIVSLQSRHMG